MRTEYRNGDSIALAHNGCDGCSPAMINGTLCHERGCPDSWRDYAIDCFTCGFEFYPSERGRRVCPDCIEDSEARELDREDGDALSNL